MMKKTKLFLGLGLAFMMVSPLMANGNTESSNPSKEAMKSNLPYSGVTLTLLKDRDSDDAGLHEVIKLAEEKLGLTVDVELRMGGAEGDNIVKTRLASGDMSDICVYNSGSLLKALNPQDYFIDLSGQDFIKRLDSSYAKTVTFDGKTYGIPFSCTQAGAIIYNKKIYKDLGLSVPHTWKEFLSNCDKIKASGKTAVIATYGDSWIAQVPFLGDNYNLIAANPDFPAEFEAGKAKYATTPAGVESFQKIIDLIPYVNKDYMAAIQADGCDMLATGAGAHWIMLSQVLTNIANMYPDNIDDLGIFGIPSDDPNNQGLTIWMPGSLYINKYTKHKDAALAFFSLFVSQEGLDAYYQVAVPEGPSCIKGYALPSSACSAVRVDMQQYFDENKTAPAMEFLTSVKGSNCMGICQECGSGQVTAKEAAREYDLDCVKQATQLGLDWK